MPETEGKYMKVLSNTLDSTLTSHAIKSEKEIVDNIAKFIDEKKFISNEITDQVFNEVILYYYNAFLEFLEIESRFGFLAPDGDDGN